MTGKHVFPELYLSVAISSVSSLLLLARLLSMYLLDQPDVQSQKAVPAFR